MITLQTRFEILLSYRLTGINENVISEEQILKTRGHALNRDCTQTHFAIRDADGPNVGIKLNVSFCFRTVQIIIFKNLHS